MGPSGNTDSLDIPDQTGWGSLGSNGRWVGISVAGRKNRTDDRARGRGVYGSSGTAWCGGGGVLTDGGGCQGRSWCVDKMSPFK